MLQKTSLFLFLVVVLYLMNACFSLEDDERFMSSSKDEEAKVFQLKPRKRSPCIIGTRYRSKHCVGKRFFKVQNLKVCLRLFSASEMH